MVWARTAVIDNSPTATWLIGNCFLEVYGVEENRAEGLKRMEGAAELGDARAQWNMALAYQKGDIFPKNYAKMFDLLNKSAKQGNLMGMVLLGKCYLNGWGTNRNRIFGRRLIKKSADEGCEFAIEFIADNPQVFGKH